MNANGNLDTLFGTNGICAVVLGLGSNAQKGLALQTDGKILLSGLCLDFTLKGSFGLARFKINGTLDSAFGTNGTIITAFNTIHYADYGYDVVIQQDGKIIEIGMASNNAAVQGFGLVRFNTNGSLDNTFGLEGKVVTPIGNSDPFGTCVALQPDGKIIVGGFSWSSSVGNAPCPFCVARYNSDGSLDSDFGIGGKVTTYFGAGGSSGTSYDCDEGLAIALQSDGKILMTGRSYLGSDSTTSIPIARYNVDGSLDANFGVNGKVRTLNENYNFDPYDIALLQDGKIIVVGGIRHGYYPDTIFVALYNQSGVLDSTFGNNGIVITSNDNANVKTDGTASGTAIQADGKILVAARLSSIGGAALRYISGLNVGILNISVSDAPTLIYPNPIRSNATLEYTLTENENLTITLIDLQGKQVQTFITNQNRNAGEHTEELYFDDTLPAGNYVLQISNGVHQQSIKIIIEK